MSREGYGSGVRPVVVSDVYWCFDVVVVVGLQATQVSLKEEEIHSLVNKAREIFMAQPVLLELEAPLKIVGDVHGQ